MYVTRRAPYPVRYTRTILLPVASGVVRDRVRAASRRIRYVSVRFWMSVSRPFETGCLSADLVSVCDRARFTLKYFRVVLERTPRQFFSTSSHHHTVDNNARPPLFRSIHASRLGARLAVGAGATISTLSQLALNQKAELVAASHLPEHHYRSRIHRLAATRQTVRYPLTLYAN